MWNIPSTRLRKSDTFIVNMLFKCFLQRDIIAQTLSTTVQVTIGIYEFHQDIIDQCMKHELLEETIYNEKRNHNHIHM